MAPNHLTSLALEDVEQCAAALRLLRKLIGDGPSAYAKSIIELRNSLDIAWVAAMRLQTEMKEARAVGDPIERRKRAATIAA